MTAARAFLWNVEAHDVGHLVGRMFDSARDGALVVMSPASDTHRTRVDPDDLAGMLPPGSEIAVLSSMDASVKLSALVDPAFQCYGGGVRVVLPHADRSDNWRRHRLFTIYPGDDAHQACQRIAAFTEESSWSQTRGPGGTEHVGAFSDAQAEALARFGASLALDDAPSVPPVVVEVSLPSAPVDAEAQDIEVPAAHEAQGERIRESVVFDDLSLLLDAQTSAIVEAVRRVVDDDVLGVLDLQGSAARQRSRADAVEQELAELQRRYDSFLERDRDIPVVYSDPEKQFRWEVEYEWLTATPEDERQSLRGYALSQGFLESLEAPIVPRRKAIQVVLDVLTRQVWERRKCHQFNDAARGGTQRTRSDGAVAWRAYVKAESPGAPRLTWWELPDGTVDLEHVGHHDDNL